MRMAIILGALAAVALVERAAAQSPFSYSYAELGYFSSDANDVTTDGLGLRGSYELLDIIHVFANYSDLDGEIGPFEVAREHLELGAGVAWSQDTDLDLIGRVSYVSLDLDVDAPGLGSADDDGLGFEIAARKQASEALELNGGFQYVRFDGGSDETMIRLGARYYFRPDWAGLFDLEYSDGNPTIVFGARYDFGR